MKIKLKLDPSGTSFSFRNIKLCALEIRHIFNIGRDVESVSLVLSKRNFIGASKAIAYCHKRDVPYVKFEKGDPHQILMTTFAVLASKIGIKVKRLENGGFFLTPRVIYVRVTPV